MRSTQSRVLVGGAWTLLYATTSARAVAIISTYQAYMSGILAVGGVLLGAIIVVLVMCCSWKASTLRLQPRERRMWETAPSSSKDAAVLEKLNAAADAPRKRKAKKGAQESGSVSPPDEADIVSPAGRSAGKRNSQSPGADAVSPGGRSGGANPYASTEDDVVAFNSSLSGKGAYF